MHAFGRPWKASPHIAAQPRLALASERRRSLPLSNRPRCREPRLLGGRLPASSSSWRQHLHWKNIYLYTSLINWQKENKFHKRQEIAEVSTVGGSIESRWHWKLFEMCPRTTHKRMRRLSRIAAESGLTRGSRRSKAASKAFNENHL